ncbi:gamma-aminobutyric acid receptor subunit beta [Lingula anatina]|uniref:Gamma-aminobutyric acid receptor subunit beta n=1 Tax=Lingula anatina TaxID=7574 RepID=A0A1S3KF23_LINAN|nr:gamma-aminobutyric acid receptor subunit beta [Lingula anatina]|eukprot:XP_013421059.1 gamma-aminobutyric acid receptor subunit beta [Lingula anatina]
MYSGNILQILMICLSIWSFVPRATGDEKTYDSSTTASLPWIETRQDSTMEITSAASSTTPHHPSYTATNPPREQMPEYIYDIGDPTSDENVTYILDSLLKGYDKRLRPNYNGPPVEVDVNMFISTVSSVSEADMDFTLDFYFRQYWKDHRLSFNSSSMEEISLPNNLLSEIWVPDTFFVNAKKSVFHFATVKNAFLRLTRQGVVYCSFRLTVTASCPMDLTYFPMDTQICSLEIESYGYKSSDIKYRWYSPDGDPLGISEDVQLPQFVIRGHREVVKIFQLSTGNYSRLALDLYLDRNMGYYLTHIYIPSILIVVISWVSFWLHEDAVPARIALGITTVLTMTTLISTTNQALPKISYLKSIDVYLVTCFVMVFASLLEYAAVNYLGKLAKHKTKLPEMPNQSKQKGTSSCKKSPDLRNIREGLRPFAAMSMAWPPDPEKGHHQNAEARMSSMAERYRTQYHPIPTRDPVANGDVSQAEDLKDSRQREPSQHPGHAGWKCGCCTLSATILDDYSRFLFPLSFIVFNICYWTIYWHISNLTMSSDFTPL